MAFGGLALPRPAPVLQRPALSTPEVVGAFVLLLPLRRRVGPGPIYQLQPIDFLQIVHGVAERLVRELEF